MVMVLKKRRGGRGLGGSGRGGGIGSGWRGRRSGGVTRVRQGRGEREEVLVEGEQVVVRGRVGQKVTHVGHGLGSGGRRRHVA